MGQRVKIPRGTFDILPQESYKWRFLKNTFIEMMSNYNYKEIITPIFERSNLFERSVGDTSDIVEKEMYKFTDKKNREFALRPEGTASVVRSYIDNGMHTAGGNTKLYYMGPMFRYDRPQKGRYRQFYQYGIEIIGSKHPYVDAEIISVGHNFLKKLGLKDIELQINSIGNPKKDEKYSSALIEYFSPHKDHLCEDCRNRLDKNPRRLLDCKVESCKEIAKDAPSILDYLDEESKKDFEQVKFYLDKMGIEYVVNPKIVRGLDYYTNTAFEFINKNLGAQSTILAGGRYNGLVEDLGGKDQPGVGFAGGFTRLILSMEEQGLKFGEEPSPKVFVVAVGDQAKSEAVKIINELRLDGVACDFDIEKGSFKSQMKAANKSNARFALILGEDEIKSGQFTVKELESSEQFTIESKNLKAFINR